MAWDDARLAVSEKSTAQKTTPMDSFFRSFFSILHYARREPQQETLRATRIMSVQSA